MMQDEAFLQDMLAHPNDDSLRLIYADWPDDHGKPQWAQFIRLRHELAGVVDDAVRRAALVERERVLLESLAAAGQKLPDVLLAAVRIRPAAGGLPLRVTNSIGMKFILIPAGRFLMGKPAPDDGLRLPPEKEGEDWDNIDEACPQHEVTLSRPFYLGIYAVTWAEYERLDEDPEETAREEAGCEDESDDHPAHNLCWGEATGLLRGLISVAKGESSRPRLSPADRGGVGICLPCRHAHALWCGDILTRQQATFESDGPTRVGSYPPNPFGLFDMHGNVLECCDDQLDSYTAVPQVDPRSSAPSGLMVFRGGSYQSPVADCASARRFGDYGSHFLSELGLRLTVSVPV